VIYHSLVLICFMLLNKIFGIVFHSIIYLVGEGYSLEEIILVNISPSSNP